MTLRQLWLHFGTMKHYVIAAAFIFIAGIYLGYAEADKFQHLLNMQIDRLREVIEGFSQMQNRQWWMFLFIFFNNVTVSLLILYAGFFFGIVPIYFLLSNGLLLGYLASSSDLQWGTFLKGVLPHGMIEIPTLILAGAFGIRFGFLVSENILMLPLSSRRAAASSKLICFLKLTLPLSLVIAVFLLAAAIIESTVTVWLVSYR